MPVSTISLSAIIIILASSLSTIDAKKRLKNGPKSESKNESKSDSKTTQKRLKKSGQVEPGWGWFESSFFTLGGFFFCE